MMLNMQLRLILKQLAHDLEHRVPETGHFDEISHPLILRGYTLHFQIHSFKTGDRRILSVNISPADKSHSTTHYVKRGTREELKACLEKTTEEEWLKLVENLCHGCDTFYYP